MPKIPTLESSGGVKVPTRSNAPASRPMPREAFSTEQQQAAARLGETIQNLGAALTKHGIDLHNEQMEKQALDKSRLINQVLEKALNEPETGFLTREMDNANGIAVEFDQVATQAYEDAMADVTEPAVRRMATELYTRNLEPMRTRVITHEARQRRASLEASNKAAIESVVYDAVSLTDPQDLVAAVNTATAINTNYLTKSGASPEVIALANKNLAEKTVESSLNALLAKDPAAAQKNLNALRGQLDPAVVTRVEQGIAGKLLEIERVNIWNQYAPGARRADGTVDYNALAGIVDGMPNLTEPQKDKVKQYLRGKAGEADYMARTGRAQRQKDLAEAVLESRRNGGSLDDALKLVAKHSVGAIEIQKNEAYVRRQFTNAGVKSNSDAFMELYRGIRMGELTEDDVERAADAGLLSDKDERKLRIMYVNGITNPQTNMGFKSAVQQLDEQARRAFGNNKRKKSEFLTDLYSTFEETGGTADDLLALGSQKLQRSKPDKWLNKELEFQASADQRRAASVLIGNLNAAQGMTRERVREYEDEIDALGLDQAPAPDSPEFQAIQGLIQRGLMLTPENVQTIADRIRKSGKGGR